jgi:adenine-specific DNA-methyltransferase
MSKTTKLELTWIGKENRPRLEPRILLEDATKSYHAQVRVSEQDIFDNRLLSGDNLLSLKALEQEFSGTVKCIYVDPPYNTGSAYESYEDGLEHSLWLSLMRDRFEILARLLHTDGSLWVSIDDNEAVYLRVLLDEVFGRNNFFATVIWEKRTSRENRRVFSFNHDYVIVYARDRSRFEATRNLLSLSEEVRGRYKNPDNDLRGPWQSISANAMAGHGTASQFYKLKTPAGLSLAPPEGTCWRYTEHRMKAEIAKGNIWFGKDGKGVPRIKKFLTDAEGKGLTPETIWKAEEVGTNDSAKKHVMELFDGRVVFDTPKPEGLIQRILEIATNEGDIVLDSFAGSGTTGAVAQKMHRRWVMVEIGDHCENVIVPRLTKVIGNKDDGGITRAVDWTGGGGFRYYHLAPSLLEKDRFNNWIISKRYNAAMLAEAMCKFEGFTYAPSDTEYWIHGRSTERDFIYVTTQTLTREALQKLSDDVGENRSLLVCCSAFRVKDVSQFSNLTIKKIPKMVLNRCEWGRDDYSLEVRNLPEAPAVPAPASGTPSNGRRKIANSSMNLFEAAAEENHSR